MTAQGQGGQRCSEEAGVAGSQRGFPTTLGTAVLRGGRVFLISWSQFTILKALSGLFPEDKVPGAHL